MHRLRQACPHHLIRLSYLARLPLEASASLLNLEALSEEKVFRKKRITLKGYIFTETPIKNIPGAEQYDWKSLRENYNILQQDTEKAYLNIIISG
jgi:hypothetical protein